MSGDFIPWVGGPRPHPPSTRVTVQHRNGTVQTGCSAFARWWHDAEDPDHDIVGYHECPPAAVDLAAERLMNGPDPLLDRAARLIAECGERGDIGLLAADDFPDSGRIIVPTALLADLIEIAVDALTDGPR